MAKTVTLADGTQLPALGMGTWNMGESSATWKEEVASLRHGVEAGLKVVDTAEMYGQGRSESLVGEAMRDVRDDVFLVTKVLPAMPRQRGWPKRAGPPCGGWGRTGLTYICSTGAAAYRWRKRLTPSAS